MPNVFRDELTERDYVVIVTAADRRDLDSLIPQLWGRIWDADIDSHGEDLKIHSGHTSQLGVYLPAWEKVHIVRQAMVIAFAEGWVERAEYY